MSARAGYRVYFVQRHEAVLLLCGGDKSGQARDIESAKRILADLDREQSPWSG